jgi:prepilin-type N-terminal cleavage/methylation domain-containing protein
MKDYQESGFSLFEVLVAISIFAVFFIVFANSFFQNQRASTELNEELLMSNLAEKVIQETLVQLPPLTESLHKSNKKENFEAPNQDFSYTIEWARLEFPNFGDLMNASNPDAEPSASQSIMTQVFKQVQEATKDTVWQMRLTIIHNTSGREYPVAFWLKNPGKEITISGVGGQRANTENATP